MYSYSVNEYSTVCVCACSQVGGRIFVQVLMHVCAHVWGNPMLMPDVFFNLSQYWSRLSLLSLEHTNLTKVASQLVLGSPVFGYQKLGWQTGCYHIHPASIYMFLEIWPPGLHVYIASPLPTDPFPQTLLFSCLFVFVLWDMSPYVVQIGLRLIQPFFQVPGLQTSIYLVHKFCVCMDVCIGVRCTHMCTCLYMQA